jgi:hypothetical protein
VSVIKSTAVSRRALAAWFPTRSPTPTTAMRARPASCSPRPSPRARRS